MNKLKANQKLLILGVALYGSSREKNFLYGTVMHSFEVSHYLAKKLGTPISLKHDILDGTFNKLNYQIFQSFSSLFIYRSSYQDNVKMLWNKLARQNDNLSYEDIERIFSQEYSEELFYEGQYMLKLHNEKTAHHQYFKKIDASTAELLESIVDIVVAIKKDFGERGYSRNEDIDEWKENKVRALKYNLESIERANEEIQKATSNQHNLNHVYQTLKEVWKEIEFTPFTKLDEKTNEQLAKMLLKSLLNFDIDKEIKKLNQLGLSGYIKSITKNEKLTLYEKKQLKAIMKNFQYHKKHKNTTRFCVNNIESTFDLRKYSLSIGETHRRVHSLQAYYKKGDQEFFIKASGLTIEEKKEIEKEVSVSISLRRKQYLQKGIIFNETEADKVENEEMAFALERLRSRLEERYRQYQNNLKRSFVPNVSFA